MEDKIITFKMSVLRDLCDLLPRLYGNRIMVQSPLKLPWGSISWDSQGYSITIKGGQIPSPIKGDLPDPVKLSGGLFGTKPTP
jgi:hypothetical protein